MPRTSVVLLSFLPILTLTAYAGELADDVLCCHGEGFHSGQMSNQLYCQAVLEGVELCLPSPCEEFSPAEQSTWSRIKTL